MARPFRNVRALCVAGASATALMWGVAPAMAQDAADQTTGEDATVVDEIVVTGFRSSLQQALNIKRREAGAVDALSLIHI